VADAAFAPAAPVNPDYQPITSYQDEVSTRDIYYVNTTSDTVDVNVGNGICADSGGFCSLRAAIAEATIYGGVIYLPYDTYSLTMSTGPENDLAFGDLDVAGRVSIMGVGVGTPVIQGSGSYRLFDVHGTLVMNNVILTQGNESSANGGCVRVNGGALFVFSSGAIRFCSAMIGGGVYVASSGNAIVEDAGIYNNTALGVSGIGSSFADSFASVFLSDVDVSYNTSTGGSAAVNAAGWLSMVNVTVYGNTSTSSPAGVAASPEFQGAVRIINSTISENVSTDNTPGTGGGLTVYFATYGVQMYNTVLGPNTTPEGIYDCVENVVTNPVFEVLHHSLVSGMGSCDVGTNTNSIIGYAPNLRTFGGYGTSKWAYTAAFDFFSLLRDAGDGAYCPARDARGVLRVYGDSCDIGAYELITENLAVNGGFEDPGPACGTNLTGWKKKPAYLADKPMGNLTHVDSGACAFRFKGSSAKTSVPNTLRQAVNVPMDYRICGAEAGMAFIVRVKAPSTATNASIRLRTRYLSGGAEVVNLNVVEGVNFFSQYGGIYEFTCSPLGGTTLTFTDRSPSGAWYLDNVRIHAFRYNAP
jgi:CSLREA domain-containing protein